MSELLHRSWDATLLKLWVSSNEFRTDAETQASLPLVNRDNVD